MIVKNIKSVLKKIPLIGCIKSKISLHKFVDQYMLPERAVARCLKSQSAKEQIVAKWEKKHAQKAAEIKSSVEEVLTKSDFENNTEKRLEMRFLFWAYGYTPHDYVSYHFAEKTLNEILSFVSDRESVRFGYQMNDIFARSVFYDKCRTYQRFRKYYKRDAVSIEKDADYSRYCEFVEAHPVFVKKDVYESCGRSVELVDIEKLGMSKEAYFSELLKARKIILEEKVVQGAALSCINESSVNTIRCFTLRTAEGIIVPWCFSKAGRSGSFVDNGGAGGILIGIDCKTGRFNTDGIDENGRWYQSHPDSGVQFKEFQLPQWDEMIRICKEMAEMEPMVPWIGWDMAYSDNGWVVIEGNALSEMIGPQATMQKGIREELRLYLKGMKLCI